ncbi:hypothetical protein TEA_028835 [Camellia sinensis var. sinensis]|uniref:USP domain-containing protein n=1 Tax=Camellia sinensis var. sinensis TaxID=542762 RepID=A0A4S4E4X8_CAMSN|nr:hypothetical protein TEA_028835 [Camellia sinensis var. sinensis]
MRYGSLVLDKLPSGRLGNCMDVCFAGGGGESAVRNGAYYGEGRGLGGVVYGMVELQGDYFNLKFHSKLMPKEFYFSRMLIRTLRMRGGRERGEIGATDPHEELLGLLGCTKKMDECKFRLLGVVEHLGTMRGGHYVAYVRGKGNNRKAENENEEDVWYHASDAYVREATLEEVLRCEAYILFYEKM